MRGLARAAVAIGLMTAACGVGSEVVLVNHSGSAVAFAPGLTVGPCSQVGLSMVEMRAAGDRQVVAVQSGEEWVPEGAVPFQRGMTGRRIGAPEPMTIIISGSADIRVEYGPVPDGALPACGGEPIGVEGPP